ncbi:RHS repeat-associated core domain-containing protein [Streptomyces graminilatus]|uniref:RHS repeat-associated core domain-containing protein n=1 Tax=Streptomyces graminilatus TaxID=1464070 RepID=UPI0006E1B184|nr:RHS repeat-associated core domain-containing protein [Streptomyces graminilatus]
MNQTSVTPAFTAKSTDADGGNVRMGARGYNTATGRFGQVDSVSGGSANAYDYGDQNPLTQYDPEGTSTYGSC